jgi:hypothetical protein
MRHVAALALWVLPCIAWAGLLDDTAGLKGKTIVYAGEIEQITCPIGGKYDCLQWPQGFFKTADGDCFVTDDFSCSYSCKALIAVDRARQFSVYVFQSFGGGLKKGSFTSYKCPSPY